MRDIVTSAKSRVDQVQNNIKEHMHSNGEPSGVFTCDNFPEQERFKINAITIFSLVALSMYCYNNTTSSMNTRTYKHYQQNY